MAEPSRGRNAAGWIVEHLLPGQQYNRQTGRFQNIGRGFAGLGAQVGAGYLGGPGVQQLIKGKVEDWVNKYTDPGMRQIQDAGLSYTSPGSLSGPGYTPPDYSSYLQSSNFNVRTDPGGNTGIVPPSNGGFGIDQVPLNSGPGYQSYDFGLNAPDLNIRTGPDTAPPPGTTPPSGGGGGDPSQSVFGGRAGTGGGAFGNAGGSNTNFRGGGGGTLGSGSVVDPSQWGQFGIGGDSGPISGGFGPGYQLQMMSGGMQEHGGALPAAATAASPMARILALRAAHGPNQGGIIPTTGGGASVASAPVVGTGGGAPILPVGNTGIVPPNMQTGGGLPPSVAARIATLRRPAMVGGQFRGGLVR